MADPIAIGEHVLLVVQLVQAVRERIKLVESFKSSCKILSDRLHGIASLLETVNDWVQAARIRFIKENGVDTACGLAYKRMEQVGKDADKLITSLLKKGRIKKLFQAHSILAEFVSVDANITAAVIDMTAAYTLEKDSPAHIASINKEKHTLDLQKKLDESRRQTELNLRKDLNDIAQHEQGRPHRYKYRPKIKSVLFSIKYRPVDLYGKGKLKFDIQLVAIRYALNYPRLTMMYTK